MTDNRTARKDQHIRLAIDHPKEIKSDFDSMQIVHHSLPECDIKEVDLKTDFLGIALRSPIYINAMTGGSRWAEQINEKLAIVARETKIAMAVGSTHAALKNDELSSTYKIVREIYKGPVFSNVGADVPVDFARRAVDFLDADALQVHVNAPQELVMPEGSRDFSQWLKTIETFVETIEVPVIIKEVGFGMSRETMEQLVRIGVQNVDVGGSGGTNFIHIENERRNLKELYYLKNWGQSTLISLLESKDIPLNIMASGGIRHPLDALKCLVLGAEAVGISRPILLKVENEGVEAAIDFINTFNEQLKLLSVMVGRKSIKELSSVQYVLYDDVWAWYQQRIENKR